MATTEGSFRWLKPGAFSLFNRIAVVLFGLLNIFLLVRLFPPSEIGIWVLFTSVTGILETLRNGFIRNPFIRRLVISEDHEKENIIQSSLYLHIIVAAATALLLVLLAGILAKFWHAERIEGLLYIYSINTLVLVAFLHFEYLLQSKLEFKGIFFSSFIRLSLVFFFLLICFVSNFSFTLYHLAIVQVFSTLVASLVSFQFVRLNFKAVGWSYPQWHLVRELFSFGKYTFGTNISSMVIKNTDSWMIGRIISSTGVALYNPAIRLSNIVEVPTLAIASVVFPQVASSMKESGNAGIRSLYYRSVGLILAVMLPVIVPLYVFAEYVIWVVFGEAYLDSVPILRITIFYTLIIPFNRQFGTLLDALGMPKLNFYLLLVVAFLNMVFNYVLLLKYGIIGAAYATVLAYFIVFVANQFILYQKFKINTFIVFTEIFRWYKTAWNFLAVRIR
ncbi:MAG: flippase [Cyclobacteriaceae bacterium]|nr:flippase [Cyclobacteriaceae bacterium]